MNDALRATDAALARLVRGLKRDGLFDRMNIIVLADHGMAGVPEANNVMIDTLMPLDDVQTVSLGVLAGFDPLSNAAADEKHFATIEQAMEKPQQHMQCWDKTRVPKAFRLWQ